MDVMEENLYAIQQSNKDFETNGALLKQALQDLWQSPLFLY